LVGTHKFRGEFPKLIAGACRGGQKHEERVDPEQVAEHDEHEGEEGTLGTEVALAGGQHLQGHGPVVAQRGADGRPEREDPRSERGEERDYGTGEAEDHRVERENIRGQRNQEIGAVGDHVAGVVSDGDSFHPSPAQADEQGVGHLVGEDIDSRWEMEQQRKYHPQREASQGETERVLEE